MPSICCTTNHQCKTNADDGKSATKTKNNNVFSINKPANVRCWLVHHRESVAATTKAHTDKSALSSTHNLFVESNISRIREFGKRGTPG